MLGFFASSNLGKEKLAISFVVFFEREREKTNKISDLKQQGYCILIKQYQTNVNESNTCQRIQNKREKKRIGVTQSHGRVASLFFIEIKWI